MQKHTPVAESFVHMLAPRSSGAMVGTPNEVYTYKVLLARRIDADTVHVNMESYSVTSSAHRNAIIRELESYGYRETARNGDWATFTR